MVIYKLIEKGNLVRFMNSTNFKLCVFVITLFTCLIFTGCQPLQQKTEADVSVYEQKKKPDNKNANVEEDDLISVDDLRQARNLWLEKKIVNYNMTVRYEPHGDPSASPVLIKVRNNQAVSTKPISENDRRSLAHYPIFETVEKTFDIIQQELDNQAEVRGAFNPKLGYTERLFVRIKNSTGYYRLSVDKFEIITNE